MLESHVTLHVAEEDIDALRLWAVTRRLKVTHIELARGAHRRQLMVTERRCATRAEALIAARRVAEAARNALGAETRRIKIEALRGTASAEEGALYLEQHVAVRVGAERCDALHRLAGAHDAHLSRNVFHVASRGREVRFLTQRFSPEDCARADLALAHLAEALAVGGFDVHKVEREAVLFDDALALDAGWIDGGVSC